MPKKPKQVQKQDEKLHVNNSNKEIHVKYAWQTSLEKRRDHVKKSKNESQPHIKKEDDN